MPEIQTDFDDQQSICYDPFFVKNIKETGQSG